VVASSAQASSDQTIAEHYPFGFSVTGSNGGQLVPGSVVSALRRQPALGLVAPSYQRSARVAGSPVVGSPVVGSPVVGSTVPIGALAPAGLAVITQPMVSGSLSQVRPGTAAVDSGSLSSLHTRQGGTVTIVTKTGRLRLRVVAVYNGANSPLPVVLISASDYLRTFHPAGAEVVFINGAPGATTAAARAAVTTATAADPLLQVSTVADYRSQLASRVNEILALFGVLLGLAILIALLGITNTLSLSVLERTRESALLRALGLTRGQLRGMLLTEALLMALLGVGIGVALGMGFGWAIVDGFTKSAGGGVLSVPAQRIALYVAIGAVAGVAAAVLPARRAARASVVLAMAET
jgi:putative ABC transport system permease protein